ncbi:MAG: hypothetical protein KF762_04970 [Acidobacteria bacterium]|nr:hypothetical protein [Acidobacteriota bacterium]
MIGIAIWLFTFTYFLGNAVSVIFPVTIIPTTVTLPLDRHPFTIRFTAVDAVIARASAATDLAIVAWAFRRSWFGAGSRCRAWASVNSRAVRVITIYVLIAIITKTIVTSRLPPYAIIQCTGRPGRIIWTTIITVAFRNKDSVAVRVAVRTNLRIFIAIRVPAVWISVTIIIHTVLTIALHKLAIYLYTR